MPEEFPLVLTVFMVMGAWRLSKSNVLTRRPSAIETLGAATVICADKTGTLTQNRMSVELVSAATEQWRPEQSSAALAGSPTLKQIVEMATLASVPETSDPMDHAVAELCSASGSVRDATRLHTYPLQPESLAVTSIYENAGEGRFVAAKGAPEAIARLCHWSLSERDALLTRVTALAIARQAHLKADAVLSGEELAGLDDTALRSRIAHFDVFARVMPQQKLRIVEALKANGEVVAMMGEPDARRRAGWRESGVGMGPARCVRFVGIGSLEQELAWISGHGAIAWRRPGGVCRCCHDLDVAFAGAEAHLAQTFSELKLPNMRGGTAVKCSRHPSLLTFVRGIGAVNQRPRSVGAVSRTIGLFTKVFSRPLNLATYALIPMDIAGASGRACSMNAFCKCPGVVSVNHCCECDGSALQPATARSYHLYESRVFRLREPREPAALHPDVQDCEIVILTQQVGQPM